MVLALQIGHFPSYLPVPAHAEGEIVVGELPADIYHNHVTERTTVPERTLEV